MHSLSLAKKNKQIITKLIKKLKILLKNNFKKF